MVKDRPGMAIAALRWLPLHKSRGRRLLRCQRSQKPIERLLGEPSVQNRQRPNSQPRLHLLFQQGIYLLSVQQPRLLKVISNGVIPTNLG